MRPCPLEEIRRSFNEAAADEEHFPSTIDPRIFHVQLILRFFGDLDEGRVLDVGCGKGRFARVMKDQNPDAAYRCLRSGGGNAAMSFPPDIAPCCGSMTALPFPDCRFRRGLRDRVAGACGRYRDGSGARCAASSGRADAS